MLWRMAMFKPRALLGGTLIPGGGLVPDTRILIEDIAEHEESALVIDQLS